MSSVSAADGVAGVSLDGQTALVTGGGRGIGRTIAEYLSRAGAAVAVLARTQAELDETVAAIEQAGGRAIALAADVTDREAVEQAVARTERELGPIDLLVNNAAVAMPVGRAWEVDPEAWWRTIGVNLRGPFLCSRAVLPGMIGRGSGRIVNIVAVAAFNTAPFMSAYGSSKAALVSFTDDLAAETKEHGVSVFAIRPGVVQTRMQAELRASPYLQARRGGAAPGHLRRSYRQNGQPRPSCSSHRPGRRAERAVHRRDQGRRRRAGRARRRDHPGRPAGDAPEDVASRPSSGPRSALESSTWEMRRLHGHHERRRQVII